MKKTVPILISTFIVALMAGLSCIFDNREIIFPEISAIAVGLIVSSKMSWNVSKIRMFICITLCAVCGVLIVKYLPFPIWMQMIIGYVFAQVFLIISKTTFAPMISAMVLPIMLQTSTPIYIVSAMFFTALILLFRIILEKTKTVKYEQYIKMLPPNKNDFINLILRTVLVSPFIIAAISFNLSFVVAPPLLVAFTEFSKENCPALKKLPVAVVLITVAALVGSGCRYIFNVVFNLPLFLSSAIAIILIILLMYKMKMYLPPAGAITILAMLIPTEQLLIFPLEVFIGISIFSVVAKICFKKRSSK